MNENEELFSDDEEMKKADALAERRRRAKENLSFLGYRGGRVCACCVYFDSLCCECSVLAEYKELNFSVSEYGVCKKFERRKENDR